MTPLRAERALCGALLFVALLFGGPPAAAAGADVPECRALQEQDVPYDGPEAFSRGLLWRVDKAGASPSYLFGTIHVAWRRVAEQVARAGEALAASELFMPEALPEPGQVKQLRQSMFFSDGRRLNEVVAPAIYRAAARILSAYHFDESQIALMQPWAAYLVMNYPAELGAIVDMRLLELAKRQGIRTQGLETLEQQSRIFRDLPMADQAQLLADSACHYETLTGGFERMIALYQAEDLAGMSAFAERYRFADNALYEALTTELLARRNAGMLDEMLPALEQGAAFIAVGALHLPGEQGILAALRARRFNLTRVDH